MINGKKYNWNILCFFLVSMCCGCNLNAAEKQDSGVVVEPLKIGLQGIEYWENIAGSGRRKRFSVAKTLSPTDSTKAQSVVNNSSYNNQLGVFEQPKQRVVPINPFSKQEQYIKCKLYDWLTSEHHFSVHASPYCYLNFNVDLSPFFETSRQLIVMPSHISDSTFPRSHANFAGVHRDELENILFCICEVFNVDPNVLSKSRFGSLPEAQLTLLIDKFFQKFITNQFELMRLLSEQDKLTLMHSGSAIATFLIQLEIAQSDARMQMILSKQFESKMNKAQKQTGKLIQKFVELQNVKNILEVSNEKYLDVFVKLCQEKKELKAEVADLQSLLTQLEEKKTEKNKSTEINALKAKLWRRNAGLVASFIIIALLLVDKYYDLKTLCDCATLLAYGKNAS